MESFREIVEHYHHCATCQHFAFREEQEKKIPICKRLGFDTHPSYQFDCWNPKSRVRQKLHERLLAESVGR
ncbi:hypothetical protein [Pullulanibacillus camelliae]|nr:hypothetical protein [Pullulanibacillus camelliae]